MAPLKTVNENDLPIRKRSRESMNRSFLEKLKARNPIREPKIKKAANKRRKLQRAALRRPESPEPEVIEIDLEEEDNTVSSTTDPVRPVIDWITTSTPLILGSPSAPDFVRNTRVLTPPNSSPLSYLQPARNNLRYFNQTMDLDATETKPSDISSPGSSRFAFQPMLNPIASIIRPSQFPPDFLNSVRNPPATEPLSTPERVSRSFTYEDNALAVGSSCFNEPSTSLSASAFLLPSPSIPKLKASTPKASKRPNRSPRKSNRSKKLRKFNHNKTINLESTLSDDDDIIILDVTEPPHPQTPEKEKGRGAVAAMTAPSNEDKVVYISPEQLPLTGDEAPLIVDLSMELEDGELRDEDGEIDDGEEVEFVGVHYFGGSSSGRKSGKSITPKTPKPTRNSQLSKSPGRKQRNRSAGPTPGSSKNKTPKKPKKPPLLPTPALLARRKSLIRGSVMGNSSLVVGTPPLKVNTRAKALKRLGKTRFGTPLALRQQLADRNPTNVSGRYGRLHQDQARAWVSDKNKDRGGERYFRPFERDRGVYRNLSPRRRTKPQVPFTRDAAMRPDFVRSNNYRRHGGGRAGDKFKNPSLPLNINRIPTHLPPPAFIPFNSGPMSGLSFNSNSNLTSGSGMISAGPGTSQSSAEPSAFGTNMFAAPVAIKKGDLRPIMIDGSNVAMGHGNNTAFSSRGIQLCVDYFKALGHPVIMVFIPRFRAKPSQCTDTQILDQLEKEGILKFTPSRELPGGKHITSYDDRFVVQCAAAMGGVIVSNDNFRDLMEVEPSWREVIENRVLQFTWITDSILMFPSDPLGKNGPSLKEFLRV